MGSKMKTGGEITGNPTVVPLRGPRSTLATPETQRLVAELKAVAIEELVARLTRMFDGADDLLFEFAERAVNNAEQRLYFDTMRTVRLGRPDMLQRFIDGLGKGFAPATDAAAPKTAAPDSGGDDFSLQDPELLERDIAVSNMANKAEGLYKQALWDINRRFSVLAEQLHAPMEVDAVAPARICTVFRSAAEALNVEFRSELVIYKLFDRLVIGELGELYARTLHLLQKNGIQVAAPVAAARAPQVPSQPPVGVPAATDAQLPPGAASGPVGAVPQYAPPYSGHAPLPAGGHGFNGGMPAAGAPGHTPASGASIGPAALPGWNQALATPTWSNGLAAPAAGYDGDPAGAPGLDPQTMSTLRRLQAVDRANARYGNAELAADLAAAAGGRPITGWGPQQTAAYVQRTGLVGRMFNDIIDDPHLPSSLRTPFDALRLSVIKTALDDPGFIDQPQHPVRALVNELATIAAAARTAETETLRRIEALVDEIRGQFEVPAEAVRKPAADPKLLNPDSAERFVEQQGEQAESRRLAMIKKVRRIVAEELQLRLLGVALPPEARPLIYSAWAPMMSVYLLRHGPESKEWRSGLAMLETVLAALDRGTGVAADAKKCETLAQELRGGFAEVGLASSRIDAVLEGWEQSLKNLPPASETAAADDKLSAPLLPSANGPTPPSAHKALLDLLIVPGAWFRIYDRDRQASRWLKAVALYPGMDCAAFAEFNGKNTLLIKAGLLLEDLAERRAEPLDVSPTTRRALQRFFEAVAPAPSNVSAQVDALLAASA